ncbi:MAG: DUF1330 domain-containing protein [Xanthobacteraceae bacterium]|jgi:uncharacterized protein (DUF1330 family)
MKTRYALTLAMLAGAALGAAAVQGLHAQATPPAYAVIAVDVTNADAYLKEYAPLAAKAMKDGGGTFLARGGKTVGIDGEAPKRAILISFDSMEKAQAALASSEYRQARQTGEKYAKFHIYLVEGLAK